MKTGPVDCISEGHGLLEGPLWHPELGLVVADATVGGVWQFTDGNDPSVVVPHRRGIGGLAYHENGGIVIGGRNISVKQPEGSGRDGSGVLIDADPEAGIIGFNDFTTDSSGRIYVGSLAFVAMDAERGGKPGRLHVIDLDGSTRVVAEDVLLTNGLGFSPDGSRLYHSDSLRNAVYVYDVKSDGDLENRRSFVSTGEQMPDGLAVDSSGNVWVAAPYSGDVKVYDPGGQQIGSVHIPVPMVTSLCFGGDDLRDLYIVSGSEQLDTDRGAGIYRTRVEVPGMAPKPAKVKV